MHEGSCPPKELPARKISELYIEHTSPEKLYPNTTHALYTKLKTYTMNTSSVPYSVINTLTVNECANNYASIFTNDECDNIDYWNLLMTSDDFGNFNSDSESSNDIMHEARFFASCTNELDWVLSETTTPSVETLPYVLMRQMKS